VPFSKTRLKERMGELSADHSDGVGQALRDVLEIG
jgi:hypothetical protein